MKSIPLSKDDVAIVDDENYEWLMQWRWTAQRRNDRDRSSYYVKCHTKQDGKWVTLLMHRLIMSCPKDMEVDHINHCGFDNRKTNLRICSRTQNTQNTRPMARKSSPHRGVVWEKSKRRWLVRITVDGKTHHLGLFRDDREAATTYNSAARRYFGRFAYQNVF